MELLRIFLIVVILAIFFVVFYALLKDRETIIKENMRVLEGLTPTEEAKDKTVMEEIKELLGISTPISIDNISAKPKQLGMPLREYCIKASYNSAYSGSNISTKMINHVLSRGCRFLDLQIHCSNSDSGTIAYVANITDPNIKEMDSVNRVALTDIFKAIAGNAFTASQGNDGCPNHKDPLFIHLRIIPNKSANVYDKVAKCITDTNFNLFTDSSGKAKMIDKYTQINDQVMSKVMFLIDKTYNPEYAYFSQTLANLINGETGGSTFRMQDYSRIKDKVKTSPIVNDDFKTTKIIEEQIITPDLLEIYPQPSIITMVVNYGVQITLYSFYKAGDNLTQYEDLFNYHKSAFIPMAYAINYLGKLETELASKTIQLGPFT